MSYTEGDGNGGLLGSQAGLWTTQLTRERAFRCVLFLRRNGLITDYRAEHIFTEIEARTADERRTLEELEI